MCDDNNRTNPPQPPCQCINEAATVGSSLLEKPADAKEEKETNPIKKLYDQAWNAGFGRWICTILVLGLSAAIISKTPASPLRSAASYNLAVVRE
jgi:hypothetical protein